MKRIISLLIIIAISISQAYAAKITAKLDINPVLVTDSFNLTYTLTGNVDGVPDFSPIKKDFTILRTQQGSNISMINGDFKQTKTWSLLLIAKQTGIFTIPAIPFGADQSPEVKVIVKDVPTSTSSTPSQDFIVELDIDNKSVFTQQQVIVTARLLVSKSISSYQFGELSTSNPDAIIIPLTKDNQFKTYKGNKQYIAVERKFALFIPEPGKITINPVMAELGINTRSSRGGFFDPFNTSTRTKRLSSKAQHLTVNPPPQNFSGQRWLPAQSLKLSEKWPANTSFVAGEPITRTITLTAKGLTSSQIEGLKQPTTDQLKQYPDKPVSEETKTEAGITSTYTQKIAYIPTRAGKFTLPEMSLKWWNTRTNKMETAYIGKREFTVKAAQGNIFTPNRIDNPALHVPGDNNMSAQPLSDAGRPSTLQTEQTSSTWFWISIFFLTLWLGTVFLWWKSRQMTSIKENKPEEVTLSISKSLKHLKEACDQNSPQKIKAALLNWGNALYPDSEFKNLSDLAGQLDDSLATKIQQLNSHLYAANDSHWESDNLYQLCQSINPADKIKKKKSNSATLELFNRN